MTASRLRVSAFEIPTTGPEADGTLEWSSTTLVTVEIEGEKETGFGYTYADLPTAVFVKTHLAKIALASDPSSVREAFAAMERAVRNVGREGVAATAIAAVDMALWDRKAKLVGQSLAELLGSRRASIDAYASGGFVSSSIGELHTELATYRSQGFTRVKMKIGRGDDTVARVRAAREALGHDIELFVDANGACDAKRAIALAMQVGRYGVTWFEEPVSSDDLDGLRMVRENVEPAILVAAGEYGYTRRYFDRMLSYGAVDVLQADATRCGVSGFIAASELCDARSVPLSAHCAPTIHAQLGCALPRMIHVEHFHDHARIEGMLFDGAILAKYGVLVPARDRPGLGIALRRADARKHQIFDESVTA